MKTKSSPPHEFYDTSVPYLPFNVFAGKVVKEELQTHPSLSHHCSGHLRTFTFGKSVDKLYGVLLIEEARFYNSWSPMDSIQTKSGVTTESSIVLRIDGVNGLFVRNFLLKANYRYMNSLDSEVLSSDFVSFVEMMEDLLYSDKRQIVSKNCTQVISNWFPSDEGMGSIPKNKKALLYSAWLAKDPETNELKHKYTLNQNFKGLRLGEDTKAVYLSNPHDLFVQWNSVDNIFICQSQVFVGEKIIDFLNRAIIYVHDIGMGKIKPYINEISVCVRKIGWARTIQQLDLIKLQIKTSLTVRETVNDFLKNLPKENDDQ